MNEILLREYAVANEERKVEIENELIERNFKLVTSYLYKNDLYCDEDYIQEGTIGLLEAIRRFDVNKNVKFSTYATWWIKQRIIRYYKNSDLIRIPEYIFGKTERINIVNSHVYSKDNERFEVIDTFKMKDDNIEERLALKALFDNFMEVLKSEDKEIFVSRFIHNETLEDIGKRLGYTKEWIRQKIKQIKSKLVFYIKKLDLIYLLDERNLVDFI